MSDYYNILGVNRDASEDDIKRAFRKLALKTHPDKNGGDDTEFKKINLAYETLSDPKKKELYDNPSMNDNGFGGGFGGHDIFEHLMRNMNVNININRNNGNAVRRRNNHHHQVNISLRDVHYGITKTLKLTINKTCFECKEKCSRCNGNGIIIRVQQMGPFSQHVQMSCDVCSGIGITTKNNNMCKTCGGSSKINEEKTIKIEIRKNINNNEKFSFEGLGEQQLSKNEVAGDLIININIEKDPHFERENDNLIYKSKLTLSETMIGKEIIVPHFDEYFKINTNTFGVIDFNKRYHIQGRGLGGKGDLIFQFEYEYKDVQLTETQRLKLQECFKELNLI
jgi:DnaJ-class molecular chaperone